MGLKAFIAKRIVYSFILLLLVICVNFVIFMMMPGDPSMFLIPVNPAGGIETAEERAERERVLAEVWGYGEALQIQLIKYVRNLLTWKFGRSFVYKCDVSRQLNWRIPYTLLLLGSASAISTFLGIVLGVLVIQKRGSLFDSGAVATCLFTGALPTFWLGLIFLLVFYVKLGWFPNAGAFPREWAIQGYPNAYNLGSSLSANGLNIVFSVNPGELLRLVGGYALHMFLPLITLIIFEVDNWLIFARACMLETITEDYIITARAKGLSETTVMYKHALKNAALPLVTSITLSFGFILSGAMITEAVYTYPGIGRFTFDAITFHDYSILMAIFYVISICVITANIVADLLYGILDPRIRYG